jgi:type IV pilus assembly protein PilO
MPPLASVMPDKPWYYGLILGVVLIAAIVFGVKYGLVNDIDQQISSNQNRMDEIQKKIEQGRTAQKKLPQFREEVQRLELELDNLRRILPSSRNTEEIIKKVKSLVDQGNLQLKSLSFPEPVSSGSDVYADWNIAVNLEGTYHNLAILFDRLSNFPRIITVDKFTISALPSQDSRTLSANFIAKTFVYTETEGDEVASGQPNVPGNRRGGAR